MEESLKRTIYSSDMESEYDEHAKRLLSHKIILAHILVNTVSEFSGMTPEQVVPLIEETPKVSTVPADPGETNYEKNNGRNRAAPTFRSLIFHLFISRRKKEYFIRRI